MCSDVNFFISLLYDTLLVYIALVNNVCLWRPLIQRAHIPPSSLTIHTYYPLRTGISMTICKLHENACADALHLHTVALCTDIEPAKSSASMILDSNHLSASSYL